MKCIGLSFCVSRLPLLPFSAPRAVGSCPAQFIVKLLAAAGQKVNGGSEDNCFLKINIYFILLWYGLVSMETAVEIFFPRCWIQWRWCSTSRLRSGEILKNYCLCALLRMCGCGGWERSCIQSKTSADTLYNVAFREWGHGHRATFNTYMFTMHSS